MKRDEIYKNYNHILNKLSESKFTVLAGAGISYESGLPTVSSFYKHFLPIFFTEDDANVIVDIIRNSKIPFERMMEHIFSHTDNDLTLLDIFSKGEPNFNHRALSRLFLCGKLDDIYTTNFDCLIEKAIDNDNFGGISYGKFISEKEFEQAYTECMFDQKIIKLHGSIEKKDSIRTTLDLITNSSLLSSRKLPIEHLFFSGEHDLIVVIGYSFSDIFDINKYIIENSVSKELIIVSHSSTEKLNIEPLDSFFSNPNINPFHGKSTKGCVLYMNTSEFLYDLVLAISDCSIEKGLHPLPTQYHWQEDLRKWARRYNNVQKKVIGAGICNSMNLFSIADKYITYAEAVSPKKDVILYASTISNYILTQSRVKRNQKNYQELIDKGENAILLLQKERKGSRQGKCTHVMADLLFRCARIWEDGFRDYEKALRGYYEAYRLEYKGDNVKEMSRTLHQIGYVYFSLKNIPMAIKCFDKSIHLKEMCGYIGGVARTNYAIASILFRGEAYYFDKAKEYLRKAENIAIQSGEYDLMGYIRNLKAYSSIYEKRWEEGLTLCQQNFDSPGLPQEVIVTSHQLYAKLSIFLLRYCCANNHLQIALNKCEGWGEKDRLQRIYQDLAFTHLMKGEPKQCLYFLEKYIPKDSNIGLIDIGYYHYYAYCYHLQAEELHLASECLKKANLSFSKVGLSSWINLMNDRFLKS